MSYKVEIDNEEGIPIGMLYTDFQCTELDTDYVDGTFDFDYLVLYGDTREQDRIIKDYKEACELVGEKLIDAYLEGMWDNVDVSELQQEAYEHASARAYDDWKDSRWDN